MKIGRTWYAAALLASAIAVLLVGWFLSGWGDVRARQRAAETAPAHEASARGNELAHELRAELAQLIAREVERPYFHYQNLMHDPRATGSVGVTPSPLASGATEPLVLGYFQLDSHGQATTPTINDDVPDLSEPRQLAGNLRFRAEVGRSLISLAPPERTGQGTLVAEATQVTPPRQTPPVVRTTPPVVKQPETDAVAEGKNPEVAIQAQQQQQQAQVFTIDENSYIQNWNSNSIYQQYRNAPGLRRDGSRTATGNERVPATDGSTSPNVPAPGTTSAPRGSAPVTIDAGAPPSDADASTMTSDREVGTAETAMTTATPDTASPTTPAPKPVTPAPRPRPRPVAKPAPAEEPPKPVMITVAPLEWRTMTFDGKPALLAVRHVDTPDGGLSQGFVIDRSALTSWLASRAGDNVVELVRGDDGNAEIAPGWQLSVAPNPRAVAEAATSAARLATAFLLRFIVLGVIAALAAALVVVLVASAERLARERSQFAAAAAHELRTPLAGLQLYGDMLADGLGDPQKQRDYAKRMSEEASRLGRVVSNVLGFSQLERGNLSVDPTVASLDTELRALCERAEPALDRAGAALALEVTPDLSAKFDRDALARIVGNLLDNAEKYGRDSEDRTIELAARPAGDDSVEIVISDHGPGIAEAVKTKLFTPFKRGVAADGPAGLGLGLALSQSLARAMGGDLTYRPADGGGASFVLRLPRA
ncbi:MAG: hypothetical protein JNL83_13820 [Myxococcales bacterium]|nr:hypothetical protein [Myxococcales bacterium]